MSRQETRPANPDGKNPGRLSLRAPSAWASLFCFLGAGAGFLPWTRLEVISYPDPTPTTRNGFGYWQGTAIAVTFLVAGLVLIGLPTPPRQRVGRILMLGLAGTLILALSVQFVTSLDYSVGSTSSDPLVQILLGAMMVKPYVGPYLTGVLAIGLLIFAAVELRRSRQVL